MAATEIPESKRLKDFESKSESESKDSARHGFVRVHCISCDKAIGWHELEDNDKVVFCDKCYFKRPIDICFHCNTIHKHTVIMIDSDHSEIEEEDKSLLPDEMFD